MITRKKLKAQKKLQILRKLQSVSFLYISVLQTKLQKKSVIINISESSFLEGKWTGGKIHNTFQSLEYRTDKQCLKTASWTQDRFSTAMKTAISTPETRPTSLPHLHICFFNDRWTPLPFTAPVQRLNCGVYTNPFLRFFWEAGHVSCSIVGTGLRSNLIQWCGWNQVRSNPCHGSGFITHSRKGCIQRKIWGLPLFLLFHHSPQSRP